MGREGQLTMDPPVGSAPPQQQQATGAAETKAQQRRDEEYAASLARQEADLARKETPLPSAASAPVQPVNLMSASSAPSPMPTTTSSVTYTVPPHQLESESRTRTSSLQRTTLSVATIDVGKARSRAVVVGCFAAILCLLTLLYLVAFVIPNNLKKGEKGAYSDPPWSNVLTTLICLSAFVVGILGIVAAIRKKLHLATVYAVGMLVVVLMKLGQSFTVAFLAHNQLDDILTAHGCNQVDAMETPWSEQECMSYSAQANAVIFLWPFPLVMCVGHLLCATWFRAALVPRAMDADYMQEMAALTPRGASRLPPLIPTKETGPAKYRPSTFDADRNNRRILGDCALDAVPDTTVTPPERTSTGANPLTTLPVGQAPHANLHDFEDILMGAAAAEH